MCYQQAVILFRCHHLQTSERDAPDRIDIKRMWDRQPCLRIEVGATGDGIEPDRVVLQEGRGTSEDSSEFRVNAVRYVFIGESEEVVHQL